MNLNVLLLCFSLCFFLACESDTPAENPDNEAMTEVAEKKENAESQIVAADEVEKTKEEVKAPESEEVATPTKEKKAVAVKKTKTTVAKKAPAKKVVSKGTAGIRFSNKVHAFGTIKEGEKVKYAFEFTNTGNSDLEILNAKATCGCTNPAFPFMPIAPGETGKIVVTFNSKGKTGMQRPAVTITSNAYPRTHKLYLEGKVVKEEPIMVDPIETEIKPSENTEKGEVKEQEVKKENVGENGEG